MVALENKLAIPQQVKQLPYHSAILLINTHLREVKTNIHPNTCTRMFTAALLIIARKWKQPKCPSTAMDKHKSI